MIRIMQETDIDTVADIWLHTNISAHDFIDPAHWLSNFEMVKNMLAKAEVYVYEDNGSIQGFIGLDHNYISGIFVKSECQSHHIGKQLLDHVKTIRNELTLNVYQKNTRAVKFYLREHFDIIQAGIDEATNEKDYSMMWKQLKHTGNVAN